MELRKIISFILILGLQYCLSIASSHKGHRPKKYIDLPTPPDCGYRQQAFRRIVGGVLSKERSWPWMAAIGSYEMGTRGITYFCGGTLISNRHLVSAAHCFTELKLSTLVTLGTTSLNPSRDSVHYGVTKVYVHPYFNKTSFANDVVLLKVDRKVMFTDAVHPICLPAISRRMKHNDFEGKSGFVVGWGALEFDGPLTDDLVEAELQVMSNENCQSTMDTWNITSNIICAGNPGRSPCVGDSGGPLMYADGSIHYLIGIVSNGYQCGADNTPAIFMRTTSFTDYFLANMN